jgi:ABC-type transporter Mla subunit MlaD
MKKSKYFKLGLFILIGVGLIGAAVIVLGAGRLLEKQVVAETLFDESVDGLEVGSPVKYRGVQIGRVESIAFAADKEGGVKPEKDRLARYVLVQMSLDSRSFKGMNLDEIRSTLKEMAENGLRARVTQQGLGGGNYIGLDFGNAGTPPPPPKVHVDSAAVLYIPSAPSTMNQVMSAAEQLASDLRKANLPGVVEHIDKMVTSTTGTVDHVNQLVEGNQAQVKAMISDLPAITGELKSTVARADEILRDKRLDRTLGNVADDSASAGATINDLRRTSEDLRTLIAARQDDIQRIIADLRRTADNLAAMSSDARDNPSRLLLGGPPPRKAPGE